MVNRFEAGGGVQNPAVEDSEMDRPTHMPLGIMLKNGDQTTSNVFTQRNLGPAPNVQVL